MLPIVAPRSEFRVPSSQGPDCDAPSVFDKSRNAERGTAGMTMIAVNGVDLYERRIGSGDPVVVLHGGPGAHHDYLLPGFDALAAGHELIYYDQRGGGRSPVSRETPVGWREQVSDLEALRVHWGIERLTLAGYSWGGLLAMLYATEFPQPGRKARPDLGRSNLAHRPG